ncbi:hypothetical protein EV361DRAFT_873970 [Lentinula raphanica]|nr:hypothetical protein EV361DRAFT_873970 [Lentinula raphanica]
MATRLQPDCNPVGQNPGPGVVGFPIPDPTASGTPDPTRALHYQWCNTFQYTSTGVKKLVIDVKVFHYDNIVSHCGHQLMLVLDQHRDPSVIDQSLVDWKTVHEKKVIDFAWWNPLDDDMLSILQDNVVESTSVQAVKRGGQFQTFSSGKMVPVGSRIPSGGRPADAYTSYSGLEASTQDGLEILFNQAATTTPPGVYVFKLFFMPTLLLMSSVSVILSTNITLPPLQIAYGVLTPKTSMALCCLLLKQFIT